eukprot:TRINITY_DN81196_c0_g1_i1.p1 TRINITY_DN81196_c0_g1~~TRINITY_DN81196_c0_g1_i1.p1  ORF type:complete len:262 (+),score=27.92 TRINITY_DN81196_c0_g1_i1:50-835(+)
MSISVYAIHAQQWARRSPSLGLENVGREMCSRLSQVKAPRLPEVHQLCEDRWHVVYSTMAKEWTIAQSEARRLSCSGWRSWLPKAGQWTQQNPLATSIACGFFSTVAGDAVVQKFVQGKKELDRRRTLTVALFGLGYIGFLQHHLYAMFYPALLRFTGLNGKLSVGAQVFVDQCLYMPLAYFPAFAIMSEVHTNPASRSKVKDALQKWRGSIQKDCLKSWSFWMPLQAFQFACCPMHLRIPFLCAGSFVWYMGLSASSTSR